MDDTRKNIQVGGWVKIINRLIGAQSKVISVNGDYIDVDIEGVVIRFNRDEVVPLSFKEKWGIDKLPTLYHGTDLKFVNMTDESREEHNNFCFAVIKIARYFSQFIDEKIDDLDKQNPELAGNIRKALNNLKMIGVSEEWEYGSFYLTSNKDSACLYALKAFAGGEIGFTAYYLIKGFELIVSDFSKIGISNDKVKSFKTIAEAEPKPAIFSFDDLSPEYLRPESGGSFQSCVANGRITESSFRYIKPIVLDPNRAELIDRDYFFDKTRRFK